MGAGRRPGGRQEVAATSLPGRGQDGVIGSRDGYRHPSRDRRRLADRVGEAHRRARADGARRRPCRRPRAGRAGGGAEQWPASGIPNNPGAWLMAAAKHRAIDHFRRRKRLDRKHDELGHELATEQALAVPDLEAALDDDVGDDLLRLMFTACHPVLSTEARVALTLRLLGGLTTDEIARAFLVSEPTIAQRIVRAKRTLAKARVPFEVPRGTELAARLSSVLEVIYLIFNEGYSATAGDDWMRPALCEDALRLGRILAELAPQEPEVHGLVALMEIQASRAKARVSATGAPILLLDQNRAHWDQLLIRRGLAALARADALGGHQGSYALQAAIAACHARARTAKEHRLGAHRGALRCAGGACAVTGRRVESGGGRGHGLRARRRASIWSMRWSRSRRSRAITCCRACAATCSPSSDAPTRHARSSSERRRSRETRASGTCCSDGLGNSAPRRVPSTPVRVRYNGEGTTRPATGRGQTQPLTGPPTRLAACCSTTFGAVWRRPWPGRRAPCETRRGEVRPRARVMRRESASPTVCGHSARHDSRASRSHASGWTPALSSAEGV